MAALAFALCPSTPLVSIIGVAPPPAIPATGARRARTAVAPARADDRAATTNAAARRLRPEPSGRPAVVSPLTRRHHQPQAMALRWPMRAAAAATALLARVLAAVARVLHVPLRACYALAAAARRKALLLLPSPHQRRRRQRQQQQQNRKQQNADAAQGDPSESPFAQRLEDARQEACATLDRARGPLSDAEYGQLPPAERRRMLATALDQALRAEAQASTPAGTDDADSVRASRTSSTAMLPTPVTADQRPIDAWQSADALKPATAESLRLASAPAAVRGRYRPAAQGREDAAQDIRDKRRPGSGPFRSAWSRAVNSYWKFAETVNTRAAAVGFVICLARETFEPGHPTLFDQLGDVLVPIAQVTPPFVIAMCDKLIDLVL